MEQDAGIGSAGEGVWGRIYQNLYERGKLMFQAGDEPIPGYRLQKKLGEGQFGAVWQARAPGGPPVALKFIDLKGSSGYKEYRGIQRVLPLRHPHLVPMTAIFLLDQDGNVLDEAALHQLAAEARGEATGGGASAAGETLHVERPRAVMLAVAMALGDKTLADQLDQYHDQLVAKLPEEEKQRHLQQQVARGRAGLPLPELLGYMTEAAKGIDFLNTHEHELGDGTAGTLQHCDIKPANIMLVGGSAQVCDFGLARELACGHSDVRRTQSGIAGTPLYMAPECIEGTEPSRATDQYSLAITYFELRTGDIPFDEKTKRSKMAILTAHALGRLDLSKLPAAERRVVAKAISLDPKDRYPTAGKFVRALRKAVKEATGFDEDDSVGPDDRPPSSSESHHGLAETMDGTEPPSETRIPVDTLAPEEAAVELEQTDSLPLETERPGPTKPKPSTTTVTQAPEPRKKRQRFALGAVLLVALTLVGVWAIGIPYWRGPQTDDAVQTVIGQFLASKQFERAVGLLGQIKDRKVRRQERNRIATTWRKGAEEQFRQGDAGTALDTCHLLLKTLPEDPATLDLRTSILQSLVDSSEQNLERGQVAEADKEVTTVLRNVSKSRDSHNEEIQRRARLAAAESLARREPVDWAQVASQLQPLAAGRDKLTPRQQARFLTLNLLSQRGQGQPSDLASKEALSDLAGLQDLKSQAGPWQREQLAELRSQTFQQLLDSPSLTGAQRQLVQRIWGNDPVEKLLAEADQLRRGGKFAEARAQLTKARELAGDAANNPHVQQAWALLQLQDPAADLGDALDRFEMVAQRVTERDSAWLARAVKALATRLANDPSHLNRAVEALAKVRERFSSSSPLLELLDPYYANLVRKRITVALQANDDAEYRQLLKDGEYLQAAGQKDPLVQACLAESLIEVAGDKRWTDASLASQAAMAELDKLDDPQLAGYARYVRALVLYRDPAAGSVDAAADQLRQAFSLDGPTVLGLQSPHRQQQAAKILIEQAKALRARKRFPGPAFAPSNAVVAAELLGRVEALLPDAQQQRQVLGDTLQTDWLRTYALALASSERFVEEKGAQAKVLSASRDLKAAMGSLPEDDQLQLKFAAARIHAWTKAPQDIRSAVRLLAELLQHMPSRTGDGTAWYQRVVSPALKLAGQIEQPATGNPLDDQVKASLATIHAAQGRLIQYDFDVRQEFKNPYQVAYAAYERAAGLTPRAEYLVGQGEMLATQAGTSRPEVIAKVRSFADRAVALDPKLASARALQGYALVLASRVQTDPKETGRLLALALSSYDEAIRRSAADPQERYSNLIGRSTAHVEAAFLQSSSATKLDHLTQAVKDARQATEIPMIEHPEYAWNAWGNAEEDMAYYLRKTDRFPQAISRFERAVREAAKAGCSKAASNMNLGRCRFRSAEYGGLEAAARDRALAKALTELQAALQESSLYATRREPRDGKVEAETHYWISRVREARNDFRQGEESATKAAELARQFDPVNWPKYQIEAAELALKTEHADTGKQLATQLLEGPLAASVGRDLRFRAMLVMLAAAKSLEDRLQLASVYLKRLERDNPPSLGNVLQLRLWRSEQIVGSTDASSDQYQKTAETDAQLVLDRATELGREAADPFRARALLVLGTINTYRYHEPETAADPVARQQTGLRACTQLKQAIDLLGKDSRHIAARVAFGLTSQYLLVTPPQLDQGRQKKIKAEAMAVLRPVVDAKAANKNSPNYQRARELLDWFTG